MNSSWTGRAPRTMRDAFNPYTDDTLHPMPERGYSPGWWWAMWAVAAVTAILIFSTR